MKIKSSAITNKNVRSFHTVDISQQQPAHSLLFVFAVIDLINS